MLISENDIRFAHKRPAYTSPLKLTAGYLGDVSFFQFFYTHLFHDSPKSTSFHNGISVTSVRMSKGLEFDEVILPHAGCETYASEYDRSLLYIACTRAMHKLTLLYTKDPCPFLPLQ
ncbi:ATP-binding domain-containing protein [Blautia pseudococcoides]|nr:ATP-binding domain-containing protein [Blautia pseudococcoides]